MMDKDKEKRVRARMQQFMVDVGGEILEDEEYKKIQDLVKGKFKMYSVPLTLPYLRIFFEGVQLGGAAHHSDMAVEMMSGIAKMIAEKEKDVATKMKEVSE